jgi:nicotinamide mononucleotide transporter
MSTLEIIAVILGVINILLIIARSIWNFAFGIIMVALYAVVFAQAKLYSDAGLQIFFLLVQAYGWWAWGRNKAQQGEVIVERMTRESLMLWVAGSLFTTLVWGMVMNRFTDASYPYWDASVAMFSVAAQILMTRRFLENWWWWILVNCLSIPLYLVKGLYLTAGLYGVFLALAITGLTHWRKVGML